MTGMYLLLKHEKPEGHDGSWRLFLYMRKRAWYAKLRSNKAVGLVVASLGQQSRVANQQAELLVPPNCGHECNDAVRESRAYKRTIKPGLLRRSRRLPNRVMY